MNGMQAFVEQGLAAARNALLGVRAEAGLHLEPKHVTKSLRARVRGRLKALETIVRRLITLMASALEIAPPSLNAAAGPARAGEASAKPTEWARNQPLAMKSNVRCASSGPTSSCKKWPAPGKTA